MLCISECPIPTYTKYTSKTGVHFGCNKYIHKQPYRDVHNGVDVCWVLLLMYIIYRLIGKSLYTRLGCRDVISIYIYIHDPTMTPLLIVKTVESKHMNSLYNYFFHTYLNSIILNVYSPRTRRALITIIFESQPFI